MRAAYQGDDSEEAQAKLQEIRVSLKESKSELEETEWDKQLSDTSALLDSLYLEYELILNQRLDNIDALISDMILQINSSSGIISDTIVANADLVGYTLTNSMQTIWNGTNNIITTYGDKFSSAQTTTNNALSTINANLQNMIGQLNATASENVESASTSSAADSSQATSEPSTSAPSTPTPSKEDYIGVALAIINGNHGWGTGKERERKLAAAGFNAAEVQSVVNELWNDKSVHNGGWRNKYGISDLSQYKYGNYKSGAYRIVEDQLAWTQENGGREFIVRPSDGAILTPVAKNDSILNANATNNIWNMANSPAEFIKDNLGFGVANVPNSSNVSNNCVQNFDNIVFNMPNVKNYGELLTEMQRDPKFEKLILSMTVNQLAGKSSLAKNKSIR